MEENKETVEDVKVEETGKPVTQTEEKKEEKAEKTYTQKDFNELDKKLKLKYEKKYEGIDIAKYKEWENELKRKQNTKIHYLKIQA